MFKIITVIGASVLMGAQVDPSEDDWDRIGGGDTVAAVIQYDHGLGVAVRCAGGVLNTMIMGLPPSDEFRRSFETSLGDAHLATRSWYTSEGFAFSPLPSLDARRWREGGEFRIRVPDPDRGRVTYVIDLPPSPAAIDEVLSACDRPLDDPHEAELASLPESGIPVGLEWIRRPEVNYPSGLTYKEGYATVLCLTTAGGGLRGCRLETEIPADGGFGEEALRGLDRGRLGASDGSEVGVQRVAIPFNFRMRDPDERLGRSLWTPAGREE